MILIIWICLYCTIKLYLQKWIHCVFFLYITSIITRNELKILMNSKFVTFLFSKNSHCYWKYYNCKCFVKKICIKKIQIEFLEEKTMPFQHSQLTFNLLLKLYIYIFNNLHIICQWKTNICINIYKLNIRMVIYSNALKR